MNDETLETELLQGCGAADIKLEVSQVQAFCKYGELLVDWNSRVNLTAILDPKGIALKHFVDSLLCGKYVELQGKLKVIDVGTGAGFPGIPLKIAYPELRLTLLDSLKKRISFLNSVVDELKFQGVAAVHGRAEDAARQREHREQYDVVISRAVARLSVLAEYCLPFVKPGGIFVAMKGCGGKEELEESFTAMKILGGQMEKVIEYELPILGDSRCIILVKKISVTSEKYPRKAGLPEKKPL